MVSSSARVTSVKSQQGARTDRRTDGHPDTKIGPGIPGSDKKLWAGEDLDFNRSTAHLKKENPGQGHIVKCQRYVSVKKVMQEGGVTPSDDIPPDVKLLMEKHPGWAARVGPRGGKKQQSIRMETGEKRKEVETRGEKRKVGHHSEPDPKDRALGRQVRKQERSPPSDRASRLQSPTQSGTRL